MSTIPKTILSELNGINIPQLQETVSLIQAQPALARFQFQFTNRWLNGPRTRSTVRSFYGAGQTHQHATPIELNTDEPPVLLGSDGNANPGEHLMHALAACVTSAIVYHAAARGIAIEKIESTIEGDVDLRGFLGLDASIRNGFEQIRMKLKIKADVPEAELQELCDLGPKYSPVFDSVANGLPVHVSAERME
jgi:uncharacterized OsmC-like protein